MVRKKRMMLSMHSAQYDLVSCDLFDGDGMNESLAEKLFSSEQTAPVLVKYKCEAVYSEDEHRVTLIYNEEKSEELSGSRTTVSYGKKEPLIVSIVRHTPLGVGFKDIENGMILECGKGFKGEYKTVMGTFPIRCICSKATTTLKDSGGVLFLDYITQLKGLDAQRIKMRIGIKPLEKEDEEIE